MASIATWQVFSIVIGILASVIASSVVPLPGGGIRPQGGQQGEFRLSEEFMEAMQQRNALQSTIEKISPTTLYEEAASDILGVTGGFGRGMGGRGGAGFGFRGASPPPPYYGRGRGELPRCWYPGAAVASPYEPDISYYPSGNTREDELSWLKSQAAAIKAELGRIETRMSDLETGE